MFTKTISPAEVLQAIQAGEPQDIIDIRDKASYAVRHIPGAISNPADGFDAGMFSSIPADTPIVISCYHGVMSKQVVPYLESQGFTNVASMKGGMDGWLKLPNAPVEQTVEQ